VRAPLLDDGPGPHFGLFIPQMRMTTDVIIERVQAAEEHGFHSVWLFDHLVPPGVEHTPCYEALTLAAALAMRTSRIRIGHTTLCNQFRHPAVVAKAAVTIDHLSGGRFVLGIGWGSVPAELPQFDIGDEPASVRAARLAESLEIIELLWSGERFDYDGTYYRMRDAIMQPRPLAGRIPVLIGGVGPRYTLPLVARFADWWNLPSYGVHQLDELRPLAGSRARLSTQRPIGLVTDPSRYDDTVATAERRLGYWGGLVTGSPEEVAEVLAADVRAGVELITVTFTDFAPPETLACFAREVIPRVRDLVGR
jgi:alkanesulfonate monooxygenase SsuD/methylene tetrahydromethanopterin reductase-like flavin-dependent oxidoreductase (luciferase family)